MIASVSPSTQDVASSTRTTRLLLAMHLAMHSLACGKDPKAGGVGGDCRMWSLCLFVVVEHFHPMHTQKITQRIGSERKGGKDACDVAEPQLPLAKAEVPSTPLQFASMDLRGVLRHALLSREMTEAVTARCRSSPTTCFLLWPVVDLR